MQTRRAVVFLVLSVANFLYASDKKNNCSLMRRYNKDGYVFPVIGSTILAQCAADDTLPTPVIVPTKNKTSVEPKKSSPSREAVSELFHIILSTLKSNVLNPEGIRFVYGIPYFKSNL